MNRMSFRNPSSPLGNRSGYCKGKYEGSKTEIRCSSPDYVSTMTSLSKSAASKSPTIKAATSDAVGKL